ncbi:MAG: hypothetical protein ACREGB_01645, partial [Candidatus Saccharimonadales bacterium]
VPMSSVKVYTIVSTMNDSQLAEIRTDGSAVEWVVDNTNGLLPSQVGKSFGKLKRMLSKSSHMSLTESPNPVIQMLRYVLNNGDTVEISTDGKTCMINSKLIDDKAKEALFMAIRKGTLKVVYKTDLSGAIPVMPSPKYQKFPEIKPPQMNQEAVKFAQNEANADDEQAQDGTSGYDSNIENVDTADNSQDPDMTKNMLYLLKYGARRGGI